MESLRAPEVGTQGASRGGSALLPFRPQGNASEMRVFVSSTFREMQAEREHLLKHVFPEVRSRCRERGITFTEIDLRWGITEEESREGQVVRICLDEIDRCRPYFIGILGERYGWVPDFSDPERKREILERMPWAADAIERGCSLVELEILYGALGDPSAASGAFFYFRRPPKSAGSQPPSSEDTERLNQLKNAIRASGLPVREDVADRQTLGRLILDDLLRVLDELRPASRPRSSLEAQRAAHEAFSATRRHAYVENKRNLRRLDEHVESEAPPLIVLGDSGAGKTSLLAHWSDRYRREHPSAFCIAHFVGATETSGDLEIMTRVMAEIKERYSLTEELPAKPEQIEHDFPQWLARVQGERLVLILDALDQLEGPARTLRWLPAYVPPNVRLMVSTLKGPTLDTLREREWEELTVQPLDAEAREAVIEAYLGKFRKQLTAKQLRRIAEDNQCSNPLFLRTLLEELRVFGRFEQLDAKISHYLSAIDLDALFQRVLERIEQDYGAEFVRAVATDIWASRRGLSESELLDVIGAPRLKLSPLLQAVDHHLMRRAGLLNFFHRFVRQAVERRYVQPRAGAPITDDRHQVAEAHLKLADYFAAQPPSPRRLDELPWQLYRAAAWERLKEFISDLETFSQLATDHARYELLQYWVAISDHYDVESIYEESFACYEAREPQPAERAQLLERLGAFLALASKYDGAERFLRRSLSIRESIYGDEHLETARALAALGDVLATKGDSTASVALHRRALAVFERALGKEHLDTAKALELLGLSLMTTAEYVEAEHCFREALGVCERLLGPAHVETTYALEYVARALNFQGKYDASEPLYRGVLAVRERILGPEHPVVAITLNNFGIVLTNIGELGEAEVILRKALTVVRKALGPRSRLANAVLINLSDVLHDKGEFQPAEACAREALAIGEYALGKDHPRVALALVSLVAALTGQDRYDDAEPLARRSVEIWERIDPDHSDHTDGLRVLGEILIKKRQHDQAEPLLRRALEIAERTVGPAHRDARVAREALAELALARQQNGS